MKKRYYLIDTENVGDRWIDLIAGLKEGDILVVFYTKNHSKLLGECYLKQRYNKQIRWVECVAGNNALDQQLTGVLSYLIATHAEAGYAIYSNDKGYGSVIDFWEQRGLDIDMVGFDTEKKKGKAKRSEQKLVQKEGQRAEQEAGLGERSQTRPAKRQDETLADTGGQAESLPRLDEMTEEQIIIQIARVVPTENMSGWYVVLVSLFGQEDGRAHYIRLKDDEERKRELSRHLLPDVHKRNVCLIAMLYQHEHLDIAMAEVAYKIVRAHNRKNKKAIRADFDKQFGKKTKEQVQYYKVVKPVLEILKG